LKEYSFWLIRLYYALWQRNLYSIFNAWFVRRLYILYSVVVYKLTLWNMSISYHLLPF
jgi:hypothetical protein